MRVQTRYLLIYLIAIGLLSACASRSTPASIPPEVKQLVEELGRKLQTVSLLSPNVQDEIAGTYSEYVSSELLEAWISDLSQAPGRIVSSPWPDRIEITTASQISEDEYSISATIIEITISELVSGGVANTIPVRVKVRRLNGKWRIIEFIQQAE